MRSDNSSTNMPGNTYRVPFSGGTGAGQVALDPAFGGVMVRLTDENFSNAGNTAWAYSDSSDGGWLNDVSTDASLFLVKGYNGIGTFIAYVNPANPFQYARVDAPVTSGSGLANLLSGAQFSYIAPNVLYGQQSGASGSPQIIGKVTINGSGTSVRTFTNNGTLVNPDATNCLGGWMTQSTKWTKAPSVPSAAANTSGGSLADGWYWVVVTQADTIDNPATEQNSSDVNSSPDSFAAEAHISGGGGHGSIAVQPPTQCTAASCGLAADTWYTYVIPESNSPVSGDCRGTISGLSSIQCPYQAHLQATSTSFSTPVTITTLNTTSRSNESCGKSAGGGHGCEINTFTFSKDDTRFFILTGGISQDSTPVALVYDTTLGCRWFDSSTGQVSNAPGSGWATNGYPTGPVVYDLGGSSDDASWNPHYYHSAFFDLSGQFVFGSISTYSPPQQRSGSEGWQVETLNVSTVWAAGSSSTLFPYNGGHIAIGYNMWVGSLGGALSPADCTDDIRTRTFSSINGNGGFHGTSSNQLALLPVPASASLCNLTDQHMNWADDNSTNTAPWFNFEYPLNDLTLTSVSLTNTSGTVSVTAHSGSNDLVAAMNNPGSLPGPVMHSINVSGCSDATFDGNHRPLSSTWSGSTLTWQAASGTDASTSPFTISSATESGSTVTITTSTTSSPPLVNGGTYNISGVGVAGYNGTWTISNVTSNTFQYTATLTGLANSSGGTVGGCMIQPASVQLNNAPLYSPRAHMDEIWAGYAYPGYPTYRIAEMYNDLTGDISQFYLNPRGHCDVNARVCMFTSNMLAGLGTLQGVGPRSDVFIVYIR